MARLKSRIEKLESSETLKELDSRQMLCEILGVRDALFWPWRQDPGYRLGHLRELQAEYLSGATGIAAKASGRSDWELASDRRSALIAKGYCTAVKTSTGQVSGLRLTPLGESAARRIAGDMPTLEHPVTRAIFAFLCVVYPVSLSWFDGRWVSESTLWHREISGDVIDFEILLEYALPLLTAGLIKTKCDGEGRLYYSLAKWGPNGEPIIEDLSAPTSHEEPDKQCDEAYMQAFKSEQNRLAGIDPTFELEISIPASCFHRLLNEDLIQYMEEDRQERLRHTLEEWKNDKRLQEIVQVSGEILRSVSDSRRRRVEDR